MCTKTCGNCKEFMSVSQQCGHPMVYLNHGDNTYPTTAETAGCGFHTPADPDERYWESVSQAATESRFE